MCVIKHDSDGIMTRSTLFARNSALCQCQRIKGWRRNEIKQQRAVLFFCAMTLLTFVLNM